MQQQLDLRETNSKFNLEIDPKGREIGGRDIYLGELEKNMAATLSEKSEELKKVYVAIDSMARKSGILFLVSNGPLIEGAVRITNGLVEAVEALYSFTYSTFRICSESEMKLEKIYNGAQPIILDREGKPVVYYNLGAREFLVSDLEMAKLLREVTIDFYVETSGRGKIEELIERIGEKLREKVIIQ